MTPAARRAVAAVAGAAVSQISRMSGGCAGEVWLVTLADGRRLVAKTARPDAALDIEGYMLDYLARTRAVPVPEVVHAAPDLLIMSWVDTAGPLTDNAQEHAADLLAALHGITAEAYGHERDTLIGPLHQPNPWTKSWTVFFREQRLLYMGRKALETGALRHDTYDRLEAFCARRLGSHIEEPARPALIHGDMWGGNVLCRAGRIAAFVDPAIYHADAEIELAFSTLFGTYGDRFFRRYHEHRPIRPGFFEVRRDIYHLYPLLVHTTLFGGHYASRVDAILRRFV